MNLKKYVFLALSINISVYAQSINTELDVANNFIKEVPEQDRVFIKFFSTYSIPVDKKIKIVNEDISYRNMVAKYTLPFWIHSLSYASNIKHPQKISDTLYAIDIRDYNWTNEAWEKVSNLDPYFRKPMVNSEKYDYLRLNAGNAILRADWFIVHTSDVTKQVDRDIKNPLYYELLYAKIGIPKNIDEFRKAWGVDINKIRNLGSVLTGVMVDKGHSGVSRNNRQMFRSRTELGYYWETEDVKSIEGKKDYLENLRPDIRPAEEKDAGEAITNNFLGLQTYMLVDGQGKRVEFADPTLVIDHSDAQDRRVRTSKSCVVCHSGGINIPVNSLQQKLNQGIEIRFGDRENANKYESFYLNPDFFLFVSDDRELYKRAIKRCNGLEPEQNVLAFQTLHDWYNSDIDINQAALEVGVTVEELKQKVSVTASGRLSDLVTNGKIPREVWDNLKNSIYAQCMTLVYNIPEVTDINNIKNEDLAPTPKLTIVRNANLMIGDKIVGSVKVDEVYNEYSEARNSSGTLFYKLKNSTGEGYVNAKYIKIE